MFTLNLGLALGLGGVGALISSLMGGGSSGGGFEQYVEQASKIAQGIPKYPGGGFETPGGGSYQQGTKTTYDFSKLGQKGINQLLKGKRGKSMSDAFREALKGGQRKFTDEELKGFHAAGSLPGFLKGSNKIKVGKSQEPFQDINPDPASKSLWDVGQQFELINALNNIGNIGNIQNRLLPSLMNLNQNAFNSANQLVQGGFDSSSLSPAVEARIRGQEQNFVTEGTTDMQRAFNTSTSGSLQELANLGYNIGGGGSSGGDNVFNRSGRNLADASKSLGLQGQMYGENLRQQEIENRRNAFGMLSNVPAFGSGLNTLMAPSLPIQGAYTNPSGQYDFGTLLNQTNNQNNFALESTKIKMQPYLSAINAAASQPASTGLGGALGSTLGGIAPWAALSPSTLGGTLGGGAGWLKNILGNVGNFLPGGGSGK